MDGDSSDCCERLGGLSLIVYAEQEDMMGADVESMIREGGVCEWEKVFLVNKIV